MLQSYIRAKAVESRQLMQSIGVLQREVPGSIPSHKFLPLMCQLTARLSTESSDLQLALSDLVATAGKHHPHHVIPMLFALKCAATDIDSGAPRQETLVLSQLVILDIDVLCPITVYCIHNRLLYSSWL